MAATGTAARAQQRQRTQERILAEAVRLFVERGYERTTIRAIAGAAGVDAGLVIHYFGSKQQLYEQVTAPNPAPKLTGTAEEVCDQILSQLAESMSHPPLRSLAVLRSMLTHPESAQAVQQGIAGFRAQLAEAMAVPDAGLRADLVLAVVLGVVVCRHLVKSETVTAASPEQVRDLLRPCLRSLMGTQATGLAAGH
jgi:AcrR family transcriptional regulator